MERQIIAEDSQIAMGESFAGLRRGDQGYNINEVDSQTILGRELGI